jgi:aminoglycoside phosphotransferase
VTGTEETSGRWLASRRLGSPKVVLTADNGGESWVTRPTPQVRSRAVNIIQHLEREQPEDAAYCASADSRRHANRQIV